MEGARPLRGLPYPTTYAVGMFLFAHSARAEGSKRFDRFKEAF
jgi:hypothetical protein